MEPDAVGTLIVCEEPPGDPLRRGCSQQRGRAHRSACIPAADVMVAVEALKTTTA